MEHWARMDYKGTVLSRRLEAEVFVAFYNLFKKIKISDIWTPQWRDYAQCRLRLKFSYYLSSKS